MQGFAALMLASALALPAADPDAPEPAGARLATPVPVGQADDAAPPAAVDAARPEGHWPEVWGVLGVRGFFYGERMAPNGGAYDPLFAADLETSACSPSSDCTCSFSPTSGGKRPGRR
jgi:hypothetical protein